MYGRQTPPKGGAGKVNWGLGLTHTLLTLHAEQVPDEGLLTAQGACTALRGVLNGEARHRRADTSMHRVSPLRWAAETDRAIKLKHVTT